MMFKTKIPKEKFKTGEEQHGHLQKLEIGWAAIEKYASPADLSYPPSALCRKDF